MGSLDGAIAIVTGAGRGLGREHALFLASEGARVIVNDLGAEADGKGTDSGPAAGTVAAIRSTGGEADVNGDNVADWAGARRLIDQAVDTFGGLDILINNAGILRDGVIVNMTEEDWDSVVNVHLKGHIATTHHAATYWRSESKAGRRPSASIVQTTSTSGLFASPGQANYGAAKSAIATLSQIAAKELARYGVRSNAVAPAARTRLTLATPGAAEIIAPPEEADAFDQFHPGNVSPFVGYLCTASCTVTGETFYVAGGTICRVRSWERAEIIETDQRWTISGISNRFAELVGP